MKMNHCLTHILLSVGILFSIFPVSAEDVGQQINAIKRASETYIYAQSTMAEESEAKLNADNLLISKINDFLESEAPGKSFYPTMVKHFKYLKMKRTGGIRVFVYISKSDVTGSGSHASVAAQPSARRTESDTQERRAERNQVEKKGGTGSGGSCSVNLSPAQREVITDLLNAKTMESAMKLLAMFQSMRKIKRYGTLNDKPSFSDAFWIIGDAQFNVGTVLSDGSSKTDLKTGSPDNIDNYHGVPMLWFTFK